MNFFQIFFSKNTVLIVECNLHSDGLKFEQVLALSVEAENMTSFKLFLLKGWWCWGMTLMLTITSKKVPFHLCLPKSRILSLPISRVNSCWLFLYLIWNMSCSLHSHVFSFWIKCPLLTWWVGAAWSRIFEHGIQGFEPQLHSLYAVWLGATFLPSLVLTFLIGKMWRIQWFSHRVVLWIKCNDRHKILVRYKQIVRLLISDEYSPSPPFCHQLHNLFWYFLSWAWKPLKKQKISYDIYLD